MIAAIAVRVTVTGFGGNLKIGGTFGALQPASSRRVTVVRECTAGHCEVRHRDEHEDKSDRMAEKTVVHASLYYLRKAPSKL